MNKQKFYADLKMAKPYEIKSLELFNYKSAIEPTPENRLFFDWELTLEDDTTLFIEVKTDFMGYRTGNFALEYMSYSNDSGIVTSKADYYIIYIVDNKRNYNVYKVPKDFLYSKYEDKTLRRVSGGDNYMNRMVLVPIKQLANYKIE
jgi:hypothetical protein